MTNLKPVFDKLGLGWSVTNRTDQFLREVFAAGTMADLHGEQRAVTGGVTPEQGEWLYSLVQGAAPKTTLEVGMAYGISTLYMCRALREAGGLRHIAIDPYETQDYGRCGLLGVERAGYGDLVVLYEERADQVLPRLVAEGIHVDVAFIDGWHTFDYTLVDFFFVNQLLRVGGIVVFHDCQMPGIRRVTRFVRTHRDFVGIPWPRPWRRVLDQTLRDAGAIVYWTLRGRNPLHHRSPGPKMVALRKRSEREPAWDFYHPF